MTPWLWFWLERGDGEDGGWQGERATREQVIREAQRELPVGASFRIVEARSSTAARYEGADCVPFLRTRNHETLTNGPKP